MSASDFFKAGKLQEAVDAQVQQVKSHPGDQGKRLFLFELLAFTGDLERARRRIEAVNYGELERDAAVLDYRKLFDAERARRQLFGDGVTDWKSTEGGPVRGVGSRIFLAGEDAAPLLEWRQLQMH